MDGHVSFVPACLAWKAGDMGGLQNEPSRNRSRNRNRNPTEKAVGPDPPIFPRFLWTGTMFRASFSFKNTRHVAYAQAQTDAQVIKVISYFLFCSAPEVPEMCFGLHIGSTLSNYYYSVLADD
jgi:hypothetical protein